MNYSFEDIVNITEAQLLQLANHDGINQLLYDSRKLNFPNSTIFFALNGAHRNGTSFILSLYSKGVRHFVVENTIDKSIVEECIEANFYGVENVLIAMQKLVAHHRQQFHIPVVAITGSNGKTIVKEWLFQLLHDRENIVRSPKSYNSQIGVPMSVWQINKNHTLGIFEAGISTINEMEILETIVRPTIGILTHIGQAHAEGFSSLQQKIQEKLSLFHQATLLVFSGDDNLVLTEVKKFSALHPNLHLCITGSTSNSDIQVIEVVKKNQSTSIVLHHHEKTEEITIPFQDDASIENAVLCYGLIKSIFPAIDAVALGWNALKKVEMRLEIKPGMHQTVLINDSYSNDWDSLLIALDFLNQQAVNLKKSVILSDMPEDGGNASQLYGNIANILNEKNVTKIIGIGPEMIKQSHQFKDVESAHFYNSTNEFINSNAIKDWHQEAILLKGARTFGFEAINEKLEFKRHDTILEINLLALRQNLRTYRNMLQPGVKMMAMVKAFSYGSGSVEIANLLSREGVDYLAVAYTDEGVELRRAGISLPIMVMNVNVNDWSAMLEYQLEPEIFQIEQWNHLNNFLENQGIEYFPVHIKLDTGMHRLGFMQKELPALIEAIKRTKQIRIATIFTHLAASEDANHDEYTKKQFALFEDMSTQIEQQLTYKVIKHLANTSAIKRHPFLQSDMVRLGIGLYGVDANVNLEQVSTLKTSISQIKIIPAGETVGYGRKGELLKDTKVATVKIGYADGYPRSLSNGAGYMSLHGKMVPVIGNVCMDMTMLDITDVDAKIGDEVIVFGLQLPIQQLSKWANTIPYEIMTGINQRVKRIYFEE